MEPIQPLEPMSPDSVARLKDNNIIQAWLVLVLAICFGAALAGVHLKLSPTIEANKINETLRKVPELVLGTEPAAKIAEQNQKLDILPYTIGVEKNNRKTFYSVYEAKNPDGSPIGWVAKAKGQGYADKIELLLGFDYQARQITGLFILEQKETPGLGNKVVTEKWRSQFINKDLHRPISVVKGGAKSDANEIDAITGATISSKSVTNIINTAVKDLRGPLAEKIEGK